MPKKLDTSFEDWIKELGENRVAKLLKVSSMTVYHWKRGNALPTARKMKLIKYITKGKIGYDQIIEGSCSQIR